MSQGEGEVGEGTPVRSPVTQKDTGPPQEFVRFGKTGDESGE